MTEKRVREAVDAMVQDRALPRGDLTQEEAAMLSAAARLRASRAEATTPRPEFVDGLARRLRDQPATASRRRFLRGAGIAAAAAAVGVAGDRVLGATVFDQHGPQQGAQSDMVPVNGTWTAVTTVAALRSTPVVRFSVGAVTGFVISNAGSVMALSAVCTHQGCILAASADSSRLVCPCHDQTFGLDGTANQGDYYLAPLPRLQHRINGDSVEVLVA